MEDHCHVYSVYHPESQGALQCFHQTVKSMLTYCMGTGQILCIDCGRVVEQVLVLFFPHTPLGPVAVLKDQWLRDSSERCIELHF